MGNCSGGGKAADPAQVNKSKDVDRYLITEKNKAAMEAKLLLLGAGESGKSTIFKQMKILFTQGFSEDERDCYREVVHCNMMLAMRSLVLGADLLGKTFKEDNGAAAATFRAPAILLARAISKETSQLMQKLWVDPAIEETLRDGAHFNIPDSTTYFLSALDRIASPYWLPTDEDILRSRVRTTGLTELIFEPVKNQRYRMLDVGGQRSERRKWIHCFQDVSALIYCTSLSEYDQNLFEDPSVNRMHESLKIFEEICNCGWFVSTPILLFLNKRDLFEHKIKNVALSVCFRDYAGANTFDAGVEYIQNQFLSCIRGAPKQIFVHVTVATDTSNIKFVFDAVREIITRQSLIGSGIRI